MYYIVAITTIWFHPAVYMAKFTSLRIAKPFVWEYEIYYILSRYLHRNIVAHKLMKIQLGQGEGLNKQ
jgi:hypothetical protein